MKQEIHEYYHTQNWAKVRQFSFELKNTKKDGCKHSNYDFQAPESKKREGNINMIFQLL